MQDFRKLNIWIDAMEQVTSTYKLLALFPSYERFGLRSQMSRSAVSIPSNIAEGCSRTSQIEFIRFLEIAIGSAFELETQTIIANRIGFINTEQLNPEIINLNKLQKQISALIIKVKSVQAGSQTKHQ